MNWLTEIRLRIAKDFHGAKRCVASWNVFPLPFYATRYELDRDLDGRSDQSSASPTIVQTLITGLTIFVVGPFYEVNISMFKYLHLAHISLCIRSQWWKNSILRWCLKGVDLVQCLFCSQSFPMLSIFIRLSMPVSLNFSVFVNFDILFTRVALCSCLRCHFMVPAASHHDM